jgi:predicted TIM-barrel fold metal-dependent hydrolase
VCGIIGGMIDCHIHVVPPRLPGAGPLSTTLELPILERVKVIRKELKDSGAAHSFCMGECTWTPDDPLGLANTFEVMEKVPGLLAIGVMDPTRDDHEHFRLVDQALEDTRIVALKGYLGYLHFEPAHPSYRRYYELAAKHRVPVMFHTGDTYSKKAKLKYAMPLGVDDVAVDHPDTNFVIAHLGNPWLLDAAEVIYKNDNVWCDLSGLIVGDKKLFRDDDWDDALSDISQRVMHALLYAEKPERILYGSDWPLIPMKGYRQFIADLLPDPWHEQAFETNARMLFSRVI